MRVPSRARARCARGLVHRDARVDPLCNAKDTGRAHRARSAEYGYGCARDGRAPGLVPVPERGTSMGKRGVASRTARGGGEGSHAASAKDARRLRLLGGLVRLDIIRSEGALRRRLELARAATTEAHLREGSDAVSGSSERASHVRRPTTHPVGLRLDRVPWPDRSVRRVGHVGRRARLKA
jgi:hypothetical protein